MLLTLIAYSFINAQTTIPFTSPGTHTWIVPPCVTSITVQTWGGGGGGGGSTSRQSGTGSDYEACSQGGGGGGGGFASRTYSVTPGETYTIVVGAGGNGGAGGGSNPAANNGQAGENSTFSGPATVIPGTLTAFGGGFGGGAQSNNTSGYSHIGSDGAAGIGAVGGLNGTTYFNGGDGSSGRHSASCYDVSGAGGGGAGSAGDGGVATSPNSCTKRIGGNGGAPDGGNGADGEKLASYSANREMKNGLVGNAIGGGGSGSMIHLYSWTNQNVTANGGAGGRGEVRIIYTPSGNVAAQPSPILGNTPIPCGGATGTYSVTNVAGVTYVWSYSGTGTITGSGNSITLDASSAGTLTVTPTASCEGPPQTLNITMAPLNPGTATLNNTTFCGIGSTTLTLTGYDGTIQWQQSTNGGNTWTDISGATSSPYTVNGITTSTMYQAVLSSSGCTSVKSNSVSITAVTSTTPSVTVTGMPSPICAGSSITLTANPTNGGTNPTYQWQVNNVNVTGETGSTFSSNSLNNNDVVTVILTSDANCLTTPTANASTNPIVISNSVTPSVTISGAPTSNICTSSSVTFTANPTNGGTNPTYQWQINGVNVTGETGATFTTTSLTNNDVVTVIMTSTANCPTTPTATANTSAILVGGTIVPSVVVSAVPNTPICPGVSIVFTANPTNGGTTPTYQWQVNGVNVTGETGITFTSSTLNNNDIVTVVMTSNDPCVTNPIADSAPVTVQVGGSLIPAVTITAAPNTPICLGTNVTFTANPTNGGTNPTYQWQVNGVDVVGATNVTFTSNSLTNNAIVTVTMTSNNPCANPLLANAASDPIVVQDPSTPTVSINFTPASICSDNTTIFTANMTHEGTAPTYQWQVNGTNVAGETHSTYTTNALTENDIVTVVLTSNESCLTTPNANSTGVSVTIPSINNFDFKGDFPNVITPNNDGVNDIIDLDQLLTSCLEYRLLILNRWGNLVYEQQKGGKPFVGKDINGKDLIEGVYFYKLIINQSERVGFITIIR